VENRPGVEIKLEGDSLVAEDLAWFSSISECGKRELSGKPTKTSSSVIRIGNDLSYTFDFTGTEGFGIKYGLCVGKPNKQAVFYDHDAVTLTVIKISLSESAIVAGGANLVLEYDAGVLKATDMVFFERVDKPCDVSAAKEQLKVVASGIPLSVDLDASHSRYRLCVLHENGSVFSVSQSTLYVTGVSLNTRTVRQDKAQTVSLSWGESLTSADSLFFSKSECDGAESGTTSPVPTGTSGDIIYDFRSFEGNGRQIVKLCVKFSSGDYADTHETLLTHSVEVVYPMVQPISVASVMLSFVQESFDNLDTLAFVDSTSPCTTITRDSSATTTSTDGKGPPDYSGAGAQIFPVIFDFSKMTPTQESRSFRLCVSSASEVFDLDNVVVNYDVMVAPNQYVLDKAEITIDVGAGILVQRSWAESSIIFVPIASRCPEEKKAYKSKSPRLIGNSKLYHSSAVTFESSTKKYAIDFRQVKGVTRMCVAPNLEDKFPVYDYKHVTIGVGTAAPTLEPTVSPTAKPTTSPTSTTENPTKSPLTGAPSTNAPSTQSPITQTPSFSPSLSPVTSSPTSSPATGSPSYAPTLNPITASPTKNPTKSPTSSAPTSSAPTSKSPTANPTSSPITSAPSTARPTTSSPTTFGQTYNPTHQPTSSPTFRPRQLTCEDFSTNELVCTAGSVDVETAVWGRTQPITDECGYGDVIPACNVDISSQLSAYCASKNSCTVPVSVQGLQGLGIDVPACDSYAYLNYSFGCV
jgi:hypothetical protein